MSGYTDEDFLQVIEFLTNNRSDVVTAALEGILGLCGESDFIVFLRKKDHSAKLIRPILRCIGGVEENSLLAASILVNISDTFEVAGAMITLNAIDRLLDNLKNQIMKQAPIHEHLNLMILSNLTQHRDGRFKLLQLHENEAIRGSHLLILLSLFKKGIVPSADKEYPDRYLWVSHILCNLSTDKDGRAYLVSRLGVDGLMEIAAALPVFEHPDRRLMVLRVLRNLFADHQHHEVLCNKDSLLLDAVMCMVYPRRGHEDREARSLVKEVFNEGIYDSRNPGQKALEAPTLVKEKISEYVDANAYGFVSTKEIRLLITDLLADTCATKSGREALRFRGAYEIIRVWHLKESEELIKDTIESFVHLTHYSEEELAEQDRQIQSEREAQEKLQELTPEEEEKIEMERRQREEERKKKAQEESAKKANEILVKESKAVHVPKVSVEDALASVSDMFQQIDLDCNDMNELD